MKPRTKQEKEVYALSKKLKPHKRELNKILKSHPQDYGKIYHVIAEVVEGYQVFRYFRVTYYKRKPSTYWETQQLWYKDGREFLISRQRTLGCYYDCYLYSSDLELRHNYVNFACNAANMMPIYSMDILSLTDQWDRETLDAAGNLHQTARLTMAMQKYPFIETMFKIHKPLLVDFLKQVGLTSTIERIPEIRVALRHGYKFEDISMWNDTMRMAKRNNIETRNPFYCAPQNLEVLHDQLLRKEEREHIRQMLQRELTSLPKNIERYGKIFEKHIKPFLKLMIQDGDLTIRPLTSIEEFCKVGIEMHNCVYACGYYQKTDTLILVAEISGKRAELIELNLNSKKIIQCRGKWNKQTTDHDRIMNLLKSNLIKIKKCA